MDTIIQHRISDLYKTLNLPTGSEMDFSILSVPEIHPHIPFQSSRLRADYFSFVLTKDGSGVYKLDEVEFPFGSRSIYFTNPGHLKSYKLDESKEGYIIMLTETFLKEYVQADVYGEFSFLLAEVVAPRRLSEEKFGELEILYRQIRNEFNRASPYRNRIIGNLVTVLLMKLKEGFWMDYSPINEGNRNSQIVRSFKQFLDREFKKILSDGQARRRLRVKDFANALNLHPNYLSSVISTKTGKTINEWLANRTVLAAKSLLRNPAMSAKEVAYKLGFSEPTHFNRFFKQHTKTTPSQFRKNMDA